MAREQWVGIEHGDEFTVAEDEDGYPAVRIDNRVWAGEEDRWISASSIDADSERNVRALAASLVKMADAMAGARGGVMAQSAEKDADGRTIPSAAAQAAHKAFHEAWGGPSAPLDLYVFSPIWESVADAVRSVTPPVVTGGGA